MRPKQSRPAGLPSHREDRTWRYFFVVAGLYNVIGGVAGCVLVAGGAQAAKAAFATQLLFIMVVIMGVGYLLVARSPSENRGIVTIGLMTKIAGFVVTYYAVWAGWLPSDNLIPPLFNDLPWGILFAVYLLRTARSIKLERQP